MKRFLTLLLIGLLLLAPACGTVPQKPCCPISVYFSPPGGATQAIVKELGQAKTRRKLEKATKAAFLHNEGVTVKIDPAHQNAHDKTMIIDGETVITGSFNFSDQAEERNAENLLVIRDRKLAELYTKNWQEHEGHLEGYQGRGK